MDVLKNHTILTVVFFCGVSVGCSLVIAVGSLFAILLPIVRKKIQGGCQSTPDDPPKTMVFSKPFNCNMKDIQFQGPQKYPSLPTSPQHYIHTNFGGSSSSESLSTVTPQSNPTYMNGLSPVYVQMMDGTTPFKTNKNKYLPMGSFKKDFDPPRLINDQTDNIYEEIEYRENNATPAPTIYQSPSPSMSRGPVYHNPVVVHSSIKETTIPKKKRGSFSRFSFKRPNKT
uniref:Uncharacterized protein n=1 Tax=Chionoecetes opilio bacilliform virus TaxID=1825681 RepID=A0A1Q3DL08_9VIRU|nr:wsv299-like protein [Chionoecetes opilio bacilliform virus]GAV93236.1 hypothetical protein SCV_116 [Chionoecetes opilio bacilliform virus]